MIKGSLAEFLINELNRKNMERIKFHSPNGFIFTNTYLIIIVIGILFFGCSFFIKNASLNTIILSIGSTILTLGISLPIAVFQQNKHSSAHFKILKTCDESGICSIFISRKKDSDELRKAIEIEAHHCDREIRLLGIAFPDLINPNTSHTQNIEDKLSNPKIDLKILLLNPESDAAKRRQKIETNNTTIKDIKYTIEKNIQAYIIRRINNLNVHFPNEYESLIKHKDNKSFINLLKDAIGLEVHLYDNDPIMQQLDFDNSMFVEQYHLGRPQQHVLPFGCIGKNVPVLQYKKNSIAYDFYKSHFEYLWSHSSNSTEELIQSSWDLVNQ